MDIGALTATLGVDSSGLRRAEGDLRSFASTADNQFSSVIGKAAALAASLLTVSVAIKAVTDAATVGMKVETMGVVMTQIGKNVGVSSDALKYFTEQVKSAGVTGMEAMSALSKAMVLGLNLNQMKEFTTRVRDIAVGARDAEGNLLNTSQTLMRVMHGIESGQVEILRTMGISVRSQDEVYKAYGETIGKTAKQLNIAEKAQAMKNEVMRASAPLAGAAAAADETVGKQLASMARYSEEAKVALWDLFKPAMMQGVMFFTNAFKELKAWADQNQVSLGALGLQIGTFVGRALTAGAETLKWAAANWELIRALTELYVISKVMSWINGLEIAIRASTTAVVIFTGVTQGLIPVLFGAATTTTVFKAGATGMTTAMTSATAAGAALNAMMLTLAPAIMAVVAALGVYGAYKTFTEPGQLTGPTASGFAEADVSAGTRDKDLTAAKAAEFVGPPSPPPAVLQMNKIMGEQQKYIDEANAAQAAALAKTMAGAGKGGKGGGGKSAEAAEDSLKSFIETMNQETAKGAGDTEAILNAWYGKQVDTLNKMAAKGIDIATGEVALKAATKSKLQKLDSDFQDWYIAGLGNSYEALVIAENKKLAEVAGNEAKKAKVREVYDRNFYNLDQQMETDRLGLFKGYLDTMAGLSPMLADQLGYKRQALEIELQQAKIALDRQKAEGKITQETYEQAQAMQAVVAQAKKYSLEMENNKGLSGWAYGRQKEKDQRTEIKDAMQGAEAWLGDTFGKSVLSALKGEKDAMTKVFESVLSDALTWVYKTNAKMLFDWGADLLSPKSKGGVGGASAMKLSPIEVRQQKMETANLRLEMKETKAFGKAVDNLDNATNEQLGGWQKLQSMYGSTMPKFEDASLGMQGVPGPTIGAAEKSSSASMASSLSSFAMAGAAAGMALSAIGMLTGSKELTMAGMVISTAAAVLQTAALMIIAAESIPIFHGGGVIYAHRGLAPNERHIIGLVGEGILQNSAMNKWARAGVGFDVLNDPEKLPVIGIPPNRNYEAGMRAAAGKGGGGGGGQKTTYVTANSPIQVSQRLDRREIRRVNRIIVNETKRELNRVG